MFDVMRVITLRFGRHCSPGGLDLHMSVGPEQSVQALALPFGEQVGTGVQHPPRPVEPAPGVTPSSAEPDTACTAAGTKSATEALAPSRRRFYMPALTVAPALDGQVPHYEPAMVQPLTSHSPLLVERPG